MFYGFESIELKLKSFLDFDTFKKNFQMSTLKVKYFDFNFKEQHAGVTDVRMMDQKPADPMILDAWEQVCARRVTQLYCSFQLLHSYSF